MWCEEGHWFTPRLDLGILPGIFRDWLFESELVEEGVLFLDELKHVEGLLVCNSVQGPRMVDMVGDLRIERSAASNFIADLPRRRFEALQDQMA